MGLFESIMRGLNIGGCNISVHTDKQAYQQGTQISGKVIVKGGKIPQAGNAIFIELEEFWTEQRRDGIGSHTGSGVHIGSGRGSQTVTVYKVRDAEAFKDFSITPGEEQNFDFNLNLPLNSRLSTSSTGWNIKVTIDIPNAVDPACRARLNIIPAVEFIAIATACEEIQFTLKPKSWKWAKDSKTYFRLLPSEEMNKEFDYIAFNLYQLASTGGVTGTILFNLQEKSFMDYLKAMFLQDRIEKPFSLRREQIFLEDGAINCEGIINVIKPSMDQIIKSRNEYDGKTPGSPKPEAPSRPSAPVTPGKKDFAGNDLAKSQSKQKRTPEKEFDPKKLDD